MDNYIKSTTDYAINSKTRDLKDFDILVENIRESLRMLQSFIPNSKIAESICCSNRDRLQIMNIEYNTLFNILYDTQAELTGLKRKAVIKKLLTTKVAVLCKCWDGDVVIREVIVAITKIDDGCTYPYMNNCLAYENAFAIDDNGNEITNV